MDEQAIFHEALTRAPGERAAYLAAACGGDAEQLRRLTRLLAAADAAGGFLSAEAEEDALNLGEGPGERIGPYRLIERLGEGGFGVVYRAEQEEPVRRAVALKIIKLGMDTRAVVARFAAERQSLAKMEHPHIARILDGGATAAGRPFFVMELVAGTPITVFARERLLTVRERLGLFLQVCRAAQHAHQRGVIHRDLKPSNILVARVDGRAVAKVIDFGIAKAMHETGGDVTAMTRLQMFVGTPAYMSPEQITAGSEDIDTRTDVHGLGALLYELLTDETPLEFRGRAEGGLGEMERRIREEVPVAPSRRVAALGRAEQEARAEARGTTPRRWSGMLRGDLDRIVGKCLEKDRERRYDTAAGLARDIERFLVNEPVSARPASAVYVARKFVKRHTQAVALGVAALVTLAALGSYHARRLARERDRAQAEAEKASKISDLLTGMLSAGDPFRDAGAKEPTVSGLLADAVERARSEFAAEPEVRSELLGAIGRVYLRRGAQEQAMDVLTEALAAGREAGMRDGTFAQTLNDIGVLHRENAEWEAAIGALREAVEIQRGRVAEEPNALAVSLVELARTYGDAGRDAEAERLSREALDIRRTALGVHRETAVSLGDLGLVLWRRGALAEADRYLAESVEMNRKTLGVNHPNTSLAVANLALLRRDQGRFEEAERLLRGALKVTAETLGEGHWRTARVEGFLAGVLLRRGQLPEADEWAERALKTMVESRGAEHTMTAWIKVERARIQLAQGRVAEAERALREALAVQEKYLPPDGWQVATTRSLLGEALSRSGQWTEAETLLKAAAAVLRDEPGPRGAETAATRERLRKVREREAVAG